MLAIDATMLFSRIKMTSVYPDPDDITTYEPYCITNVYGYCSVVSPVSTPPIVTPNGTKVQQLLFGRPFWNGFYTVCSQILYEVKGNAKGNYALINL